MPALRNRLKTFENFARSTLGDLYGDVLSGSLRLEANTLESCILLNNGNARFNVTKLPRAAQFSPSQGVLLSDLDGDGLTDCVLAQNFFGAQPEIGLLDSGLSVFLHGRGSGKFLAAGPDKSGIRVAGAATALTTADLNLDGRPELAFAVNDSPVMFFSELPVSNQSHKLFEVRLRGKPGNLVSVGARITLSCLTTSQSQTSEITAGSGYLGQSEAARWFGLGPAALGVADRRGLRHQSVRVRLVLRVGGTSVNSGADGVPRNIVVLELVRLWYGVEDARVLIRKIRLLAELRADLRVEVGDLHPSSRWAASLEGFRARGGQPGSDCARWLLRRCAAGPPRGSPSCAWGRYAAPVLRRGRALLNCLVR